jgi:hypothetical protein
MNDQSSHLLKSGLSLSETQGRGQLQFHLFMIEIHIILCSSRHLVVLLTNKITSVFLDQEERKNDIHYAPQVIKDGTLVFRSVIKKIISLLCI